MRHISKYFGTLRANDDITLQLKRGEIHALLGENGAGKSTLMSILFGLYDPDEGEILKDGAPVKIKDPNDATALGIGMVHQHFKLVECFTVLENIILGAEDTRFGFLKKKTARARVEELSEKYGLHVDPDALISDITVGMQQRTEILKMLYRDNEVLILDEPTAVLTPQEIDELMRIMKNLTAEGKSILFITHKLNEIMEVADRCSVLRKGKYVGTVDVKDVTNEQLSQMMVGRPVQLEVDKAPAKPKEALLTLEDLSVKSISHTHKLAVKNVSFEVRSGEIVCIAGIDGNGQSELGLAVTGLEKAESGRILMKGKDITKESVRKRADSGMSHIPEDRHKHGLILDFTLGENMVLRRYLEPEFEKHGFIRFRAVDDYATKLVEEFDVRSADGIRSTARSMSGGNQQKAIVARELDHKHEVLVAIQPTRGLDVGAIEFIHSEIVKKRDAGAAVLLISLELEEVMSLSDRILVMYEGEIVGEFEPEKTTVQELGLYMVGAKRDTTEGGKA
ncbi:MAG: ABC transporter ATP-binding protein [Lachnospiraceae bacterium]|nr:ABC transporter ATP-binding protein [Lachnospiraceae bacterium]